MRPETEDVLDWFDDVMDWMKDEDEEEEQRLFNEVTRRIKAHDRLCAEIVEHQEHRDGLNVLVERVRDLIKARCYVNLTNHLDNLQTALAELDRDAGIPTK